MSCANINATAIGSCWNCFQPIEWLGHRRSNEQRQTNQNGHRHDNRQQQRFVSIHFGPLFSLRKIYCNYHTTKIARYDIDFWFEALLDTYLLLT